MVAVLNYRCIVYSLLLGHGIPAIFRRPNYNTAPALVIDGPVPMDVDTDAPAIMTSAASAASVPRAPRAPRAASAATAVSAALAVPSTSTSAAVSTSAAGGSTSSMTLRPAARHHSSTDALPLLKSLRKGT
ncbi:hypothetical protein FBU31_000641 [Coemansia sp. 'formosensis']|nr:hypothetical protein FBU31_000641 [Coemansia sp. 'formosensis']